MQGRLFVDRREGISSQAGAGGFHRRSIKAAVLWGQDGLATQATAGVSRWLFSVSMWACISSASAQPER